MRRLHYILVLLFISVSYLFSQNEGNELIKVDTVRKVDSFIVIQTYTILTTRVDTIVVKKFIDEQIGIFSGRVGYEVGYGGSEVFLLSWNMPIVYNFTMGPFYSYSFKNSGHNRFAIFGLMLGYNFKTSYNTILNVNLGPSIGYVSNERSGVVANYNLNFIYKLTRTIAISTSANTTFHQHSLSIGLGILY